MEYRRAIRLKDGRRYHLRNGTADDAQGALDVFNVTHEETDYMLTYPGEGDMTVESEAAYLQERTESDQAIEILAEVDGQIAGNAGISCVGEREKTRHRAEFGIGVVRSCWGLGVGRALTEACIECAKAAGYAQLELDVVADNTRAIALYKSVGFAEYGRNPRGFRTREGRWQELVLMRLELDG